MERLEHDLAHDAHEARPLVRFERAMGLTLLLLGGAVVGGWGLVEVVVDAAAPLPARIGIAAAIAGALILLFSVVRWRLATAKSDPYREVIR